MNNPKPYAALIALVRKNPGLDAFGLRERGHRPAKHGSLVAAEVAGVIVYQRRGGSLGWFVATPREQMEAGR